MPSASRASSEAQSWDPIDAQGRPLTPVATPEWKQPSLASIYALSKYVQERQTLIMTQAYGMEGVCLRLFNVYGPGQALSNPYTGVLAIFSSRLLNGQRPLIFEDGGQRRDFVHVGDVARAFADALVDPDAAGEVFNIGSGAGPQRHRGRARDRARARPQRHRAGDRRQGARRRHPPLLLRRHARPRRCSAFARDKDFDEGIAELAEWVAGQTADDRVDQARAELEAQGAGRMSAEPPTAARS